MKKAIVIETADLKENIAKHFGVKVDDVIKSQYTFTVILDEKKAVSDGNEICS